MHHVLCGKVVRGIASRELHQESFNKGPGITLPATPSTIFPSKFTSLVQGKKLAAKSSLSRLGIGPASPTYITNLHHQLYHTSYYTATTYKLHLTRCQLTYKEIAKVVGKCILGKAVRKSVREVAGKSIGVLKWVVNVSLDEFTAGLHWKCIILQLFYHSLYG